MVEENYRIYQIYYDDASRSAVDPRCLPLDNRDGPKDWYEFWPILTTLRKIDLVDGVWYGFLSPRFSEKTGWSIGDVTSFLAENTESDVALFSIDWPGLAYYRNPWEQGERFHPGLTAASSRFFKAIGGEIDLESVWTDFSTSVFSNYIIARKSFWIKWRELAEEYLRYTELPQNSPLHDRHVEHRGVRAYPLKVFVQERLACYLLATGNFATATPRYELRPGLNLGVLALPERARGILARCERAKRNIRLGGGTPAVIGYRLNRGRIDVMRARKILPARLERMWR